MYDLIYGGDVQHLSVDVLRGYAKKIGLDMDRFDADMNSQKAQQAIYLDKGLGRTIKLWGTPSYFVNGRRVTDRSPAGIRAMITEEIARIKGPATAGASAGGAKPGGVPGASANGS
jgi:protein-disulfide isomerase-like protein with CxxC motif